MTQYRETIWNSDQIKSRIMSDSGIEISNDDIQKMMTDQMNYSYRMVKKIPIQANS